MPFDILSLVYTSCVALKMLHWHVNTQLSSLNVCMTESQSLTVVTMLFLWNSVLILCQMHWAKNLADFQDVFWKMWNERLSSALSSLEPSHWCNLSHSFLVCIFYPLRLSFSDTKFVCLIIWKILLNQTCKNLVNQEGGKYFFPTLK